MFSTVSGFGGATGSGNGLPASLATGLGGVLGGQGASVVAQLGLASSLRSLGGFGMPNE